MVKSMEIHEIHVCTSICDNDFHPPRDARGDILNISRYFLSETNRLDPKEYLKRMVSNLNLLFRGSILPPIIMVQWKMGVSPTLVSFHFRVSTEPMDSWENSGMFRSHPLRSKLRGWLRMLPDLPFLLSAAFSFALAFAAEELLLTWRPYLNHDMCHPGCV